MFFIYVNNDKFKFFKKQKLCKSIYVRLGKTNMHTSNKKKFLANFPNLVTNYFENIWVLEILVRV